MKKLKKIINYLWLYLVAMGLNISYLHIALQFYTIEKDLGSPLWKIWIAMICLMAFWGYLLGLLFSYRNKVYIFKIS